MRIYVLTLSVLFSCSIASGQATNHGFTIPASAEVFGQPKKDGHDAAVDQSSKPAGETSVHRSSSPSTTVEAPSLEWELVNSFRFIRDQDSMDELRRVYDELPLDSNGKKTAYGLERELQRRSERAVDEKRAQAGERFDCNNPQSPEQRKQCFEPYVGWFAALAANHHKNTCWNSETHQYRSDGACENYIHPKSHRVRVWVSNSQLFRGLNPEWFVDNEPFTKFAACAAKYRKGVCIEFDLDYDESKQRQLSVKFSDGSLSMASIPILVKDKLIVGLGDSYAAGEGNPDIPARFTQGETDPDFLYELGYLASRLEPKKAPAKDKNTKVGWLDERCHRSMYSYQFKTALQFALANPQSSVTYLSLSCSGATTDNIINKKQSPKEGNGDLSPQLESLRKLLEKGENRQREIDYLLLSTGGNDVGFAKFVAYIVTRRSLRRIAALGINERRLIKLANKEKIRKKLLSGEDDDEKNYLRLHAALRDNKTGIKMKSSDLSKPFQHILLTPYPDILNDQKGLPCLADRKEFEIPFKADAKRADRIKWVRQYVFEPVRKVQEDPAITSGLGWTLVTGHFRAYLQHGFCSQAENSLSAQEKFEMPIKENGKWLSFDPWEYKSYGTRNRWIRLPVDSKLTTDQAHRFWKYRWDLFFEDDRSNIMHPTAEGLSETADANLAEIERLEKQIK